MALSDSVSATVASVRQRCNAGELILRSLPRVGAADGMDSVPALHATVTGRALREIRRHVALTGGHDQRYWCRASPASGHPHAVESSGTEVEEVPKDLAMVRISSGFLHLARQENFAPRLCTTST